MNESGITEFKKYVDTQISPSISEIKGLNDNSRKHVQKLVYTNLVDRFDVMIDTAILGNCRSEFVVEAISPSLTETVSEQYLLQLLMDADNVQDAIDERLKASVRNNILRKRHSQKLQFLLKLFDRLEYTKPKPQVQPGNGNVVVTANMTKVNIPHSVCGYADWLYSRRNAIVHGTSISPRYLQNDIKKLKDLYNYECPQKINLKFGAIEQTVRFYTCIVNILLDQ
ncbi:hypothetical protein ACMDCT_08145 [Halomonadaceae bacterium KBTZ08]